MKTNQQMLDAHVQFELDRLTGDGLASTIEDEIAALFDWLGGVSINQVSTPKIVTDIFIRYSQQVDLTPELAQILGSVAANVHAAGLKNKTRLADAFPVESYEQVAASVSTMSDLRAAITEQVTTNEVYASLISHVLYQGIKNYLQAENVIAKRVPGASTLMKMGQSAINTAAPKLEQAVDRQLTAFVNSNISDSIRDSKHYLDKVLDDELISAVAQEVWDSNAKTSIAEFVALVPADAIDDFIAAGATGWEHLRETKLFAAIARSAIEGFFADYGDEPVGSLLNRAGISAEVVVPLAIEAATPLAKKAADDGYLEERIRSHLAAFYDQYSG